MSLFVNVHYVKMLIFQTWLKNEAARQYQEVLMTKLNVATSVQDRDSSGMSPGAAAGTLYFPG